MIEEEEEHNWFTRWAEELPSPEELMPLSQSLITPDLALAFDIQSPSPSAAAGLHAQATAVNRHPAQPPPVAADVESPDRSGGGGSGGDEPARTLKRPRLVWTPQLHKRFVDAVAHLGIKNAVPKTIMQLMSVDGLTRENVASHLQKYRLYLKRMQGLSSAAAGPMSAVDAATEQLFASTTIHSPFLARGASGPGQEAFMQFMAPPPLIQHHQHMAAAAAAAAAAAEAQQQLYRQRQMGHFGSPVATGGGYDNGFQARMMGRPSPSAAPPNSYGEDVDSGSGGRRILTLFPASSED